MIVNFKHRGLKHLFDGDHSKVPAEYVEKLENILFTLDNAQTIEAMNLPAFHLHPLTGNLKGLWSVVVRANWRVIFHFEEGQARDVDLVDYH